MGPSVRSGQQPDPHDHLIAQAVRNQTTMVSGPVRRTLIDNREWVGRRSAVTSTRGDRWYGIRELTSQMLNGLYLQRSADGRCDGEGGLAPPTVANIHVVLRKALADAEDTGLIPRNPADKANPPRPESQGGEVRYRTPGELQKFLELVEELRLEATFRPLRPSVEALERRCRFDHRLTRPRQPPENPQQLRASPPPPHLPPRW